MNCDWMTDEHKKAYGDLVEKHRNHPVVEERIKRNVKRSEIGISKQVFWKSLIECLITTQQRSGKESHVGKFLRSEHQLLNYDACDPSYFDSATESLIGKRLRFRNRISDQARSAAASLKNGGWSALKHQLDKLAQPSTLHQEREVALWIKEEFAGIGPKQSRNLIQLMGLSPDLSPQSHSLDGTD